MASSYYTELASWFYGCNHDDKFKNVCAGSHFYNTQSLRQLALPPSGGGGGGASTFRVAPRALRASYTVTVTNAELENLFFCL